MDIEFDRSPQDHLLEKVSRHLKFAERCVFRKVSRKQLTLKLRGRFTDNLAVVVMTVTARIFRSDNQFA